MRKLSFFFCLISAVTLAQIEDVGAIASDLVLLSDQYVSPAAEAAVYQSSGGWFTSAKKKDLWDLEISLQGNLIFIPNKSTDFLIDEADLQNLTIQGEGTTANSPTALGGDNFVVIEGHIGDDFFEFDSPEGINESSVRHAQLQASLGLWHGTSFVARYSPKIKINKTYYQIIGFGIQHNLSQWIPSLNESTFDISGLITYSVYSVSDTFSKVTLPIGSLNSIVVDGQSFMFNLIASKEVKKFNFSTALGLTSSQFDYEVGGSGEVLLSTLNQALGNLAESQINYKVDVGIDYRIQRFSINSMLTFGEYTNLVLGLNYNL